MGDGIGEECGVIGISLKKEVSYYPSGGAANFTYKGLKSLQNRGQLSAGILSYNEKRKTRLTMHKDLGEVPEVFMDSHEDEHKALLEELAGTKAIGHVRYATSGSRDKPRRILVREASPFLRRHGKAWKEFGISLNGNITNHADLKQKLENERDYILKTEVDTEVIMHLLAITIGQESDKIKKQKPPLEKVIRQTTDQLAGSYSMVFLNSLGDLAGFRDPLGFKPLCYGENEDMIVIASESLALLKLGIHYEDIKDVNPGNMVLVDNGTIEEIPYRESDKHAHCMFEWVYFANRSSELEGILVDEVRGKLGKELAESEPLKDKLDDSYVVSAVPNTSIPVAKSMAHHLGIENRDAMEKSGGRSFIDPAKKRKRTIKEKYTFIPRSLKGKKVLLIDDSIVRGTTIKQLIESVKKISGAEEVHIRSSCPPIKCPCFYGIDFPTIGELIAPKYKSVEKLEKEAAILVGADSLKYQTMDGLIRAIGLPENELCLACLNADYPTQGGMERYKELLR